MPDYTIWRLDHETCDFPDCERVAVYEVGIADSPVIHMYVCDQRTHARWAGEDALRRHAERAAKLGIPG